MRAVPFLLVCAVALGAANAHAQVFKCKDANGRVVYQDGPCEGAAAVDTRSSRGASGSKGSGASSGGAGSGAVSTKPTHPVLPEKMRR